MMVVCSFASLVRAAVLLAALALVAGLSLAGPAAPATAPHPSPVSSSATTSVPVEQ
ncbi:hypothetical protein OHS58_33275 [Amycolatopsis sp. NBC_00348]|uniref:hypothetical protein n=1 Tax=Amycolatopsis sp. NBC_00348 TaxID=2975956 RepID=UPI002E269510